MSFLDRLSKIESITRKYYGNDKNKKPNDCCYWSDDDYVIGWYENDDALRKRIKDNINSK